MKLKYISLITVVMLGLFIVNASAILFPLPIVVNVITPGSPANIPVGITNLRTGVMVTGYTNSIGEYVVDWANINGQYTDGDYFKIKVFEMEQTVQFVGPVPLIAQFNLVEVGCFTAEQCESFCPEPIICPEIPKPIICPPEINCSEQGYILPSDCDVPECPVDEEDTIPIEGIGLVSVIIVIGITVWILKTKKGKEYLAQEAVKLLPNSAGFRIWKSSDGKVYVKHIHRGLVGYHSPDSGNHRKVKHSDGNLTASDLEDK